MHSVTVLHGFLPKSDQNVIFQEQYTMNESTVASLYNYKQDLHHIISLSYR